MDDRSREHCCTEPTGTISSLFRETLRISALSCFSLWSDEALLEAARDRVHQGAKLLSHPLSGSVKPGETPYKSIILTMGKGDVDEQSLRLIENAILACAKFQQRCDRYRPAVDLDCRLIDWTLLEGALASANQ